MLVGAGGCGGPQVESVQLGTRTSPGQRRGPRKHARVWGLKLPMDQRPHRPRPAPERNSSQRGPGRTGAAVNPLCPLFLLPPSPREGQELQQCQPDLSFRHPAASGVALTQHSFPGAGATSRGPVYPSGARSPQHEPQALRTRVCMHTHTPTPCRSSGRPGWAAEPWQRESGRPGRPAGEARGAHSAPDPPRVSHRGGEEPCKSQAGRSGLNCDPRPVPTLASWPPHLRMGTYVEVGSLQR